MPREMRPGERSFKKVDSSFGPIPESMHGRYISLVPATAGRKAGKELLKHARQPGSPFAKFKDQTSVTVKIEETTQGSPGSGDTFVYKVRMVPTGRKRNRFPREDGSSVSFVTAYTYVAHAAEL